MRALAASFLIASLCAAPPARADAPCADEACAVRKAVAYAEAGNHAWAVRTLAAWVESHPSDCEARTWLAWEYVAMGAADLAADALPAGACTAAGALHPRARMLRALLHHQGGRADEARAEIDAARASPAAYDSDRAALPALAAAIDPDRLRDVAWSVEAAGGYTSDARLGAPTDPGQGSGGDSSALVQVNAYARVAPDAGAAVRPAAEAQVRVLRLLDGDVSEFSYLNLTGRAGLLAGRAVPRVLVAYRPDFLLLDQGDRFADGPAWYVGGHRAEVEVEVAPWMLAFAGGGRRAFREMGRTRWEADGGVAGQAPLWRGRLRLGGAVMARWHGATDPAYDLAGGTVALNLLARLPGRWSATVAMATAIDGYTRSGTSFGPEPRRDVFLRPGVAAWTPPFHGLTAGVGYDWSRRLSTAPAFDHEDHRVLLRVRWTGSADLRAPRAAPGAPIADIPWGLAGDGGAGSDDRVQDLLRMDEPVQDVCGCGK
ncbi:MAG: hypothetical protein FJ087_14790 [Deltaproteobacteria bacterium]|nr:hypothetical protein [Deltaproteobacteria bacterium]